MASTVLHYNIDTFPAMGCSVLDLPVTKSRTPRTDCGPGLVAFRALEKREGLRL